MAKMKVADLPQEEQEKLIAEMKECKLGGVYTTYTVENAKKAIEKKKAQVENADGASVPGDNAQNAPQGEKPEGEGQEDGEVQKDAENGDLNGGENEETGENGENSDENGSDDESTGENEENGENEAENASDDDSADETQNDADEQKQPEETEQNEEPANDEKTEDQEEPKEAPKNDGPVLVCHICRSRVYNGVCSGCGNKI